MNKNKLNLTLFFTLIIIFNSNILYSALRYDYNFDLSPFIDKKELLSLGFGLTINEHNAWYQNQEIIFENPNNPNVSMRALYMPFLVYLEVRPWKFLELSLAPVFMYKEEASRNNLSNMTNKVDSMNLEGFHFHVKALIVDWYVSFGVRLDVDYSIYEDALPNEKLPDTFDVAGTLMIAFVPKVFPLNLLFDYRFHSESSLYNLGEVVLALEFITSKMITLYGGATFVFPYDKIANDTTYIEPFVKFTVSFDDFLKINSVYRKIAYGDGNELTPNSSTFMFSIEYMF